MPGVQGIPTVALQSSKEAPKAAGAEAQAGQEVSQGRSGRGAGPGCARGVQEGLHGIKVRSPLLGPPFCRSPCWTLPMP